MAKGALYIPKNSNNRMLVGYQNTDSTVTGVTTPFIACSLPMPIMGPNDVFWFESMAFAVGTNGTKTFTAYIGPTSGTTVGATLIASGQLSGTQLIGSFQRRMANKNSSSVNNVYPTSINNGNDMTNQTTARTAVNINTAIQQYFMIVVQNASAADLAGVADVQMYCNRP